MSDTEILLSKDTTQEEKLNATKRIIETYDLPLEQEEIMQVFDKARININSTFHRESYQEHKFLFDTLLNNNKNMFVAITKTLVNGTIFLGWHLTILVRGTSPCYNIGYYCDSDYGAKSTYCNLLDHYNFNVDDLVIKDDDKLKIQQYQHEKYSGRLTKAAIKN